MQHDQAYSVGDTDQLVAPIDHLQSPLLPDALVQP
jgi:hypothetical protein